MWTLVFQRRFLCRKPFSTNIIGPLVSAGFRVVAMDCRGHGLSDKFYNSDDYGIKMVQGMKLVHLTDFQNLATEFRRDY